MSLRARWAGAGLRFYRNAISPALHALAPGGCRFAPTCADYAAIAIAEWGWVRGLGLALWRLLRCHPLCRGGYDPVPSRAVGSVGNKTLRTRNRQPDRAQNPNGR